MPFSLVPLLLYLNLAQFVVLIISASPIANSCTLRNKDPKKTDMLNRILPIFGEKLYAEHDGLTYAVAICTDLHAGAGATRTRVGSSEATVIGRLNQTDVVGEERWLMLVYSGGDVNTENPSKCNWRTLILASCDLKPDDLSIELLAGALDDCTVVFHLKTNAVCPAPKSLSTPALLFILLLVGAVCYLLMGVAYRRLVAGAKGLEQIPHIRFWRQCAQCPLSYLRREDKNVAGQSTTSDDWSNRLRPAPVNKTEQVDEPLLSP